jgi:CubicO group peptidase (beta-lactamase class C family)
MVYPWVMNSNLRFAAVLLVFQLAACPAFRLHAAELDAAKLKRIPAQLQKYVDDGTIAGAVTLLAHHGKVASLDAIGYADLATRQPMKTDDLFWIASMTKPITATAVLMLQDEGKLSVDDPVEKYLAEFKNMWMAEERTTNRIVSVPAPRPITLRDLLTHTSGLGDVTAPRYNSTLGELAMAYAQQPLHFPPGSRWEYANCGINTLGRIVEIVSGISYEDFVLRRIIGQLGMRDTTFHPTPAQAKRIAKSYQPTADGKGLEETPIFFIKGDLGARARTAFPAGGLFSTASDMARFYQMMLNGGVYDGKRLVSKESVALMSRTETGDIKTGFVDGMSFGFGFAVVKVPSGVTAMLSPGTFGHGGAYGTQSWADPGKDIILILMIQRAKLPNADDSDVRRVFQQTAVEALR